jgi:uncharacterized repeat protein (TIGR02543 family)
MNFKMKSIGYLIVSAMIFGAILTSCNENDDYPREFIVSFDSNGGSEVPRQTVREGEKVSKPEKAPTLNGYTFVAWRKEENLMFEWNFDTDVVTGDITLYAEWIEDCVDFCLCANVENFFKTAPFINEYLITLPNNWSDERKMQAFEEWLNSKSCITVVDFEIIPNWCWTPPVQYATSVVINILLDDNGVEREIILIIAKEVESNFFIATSYQYPKPKEIIVSTSYDINVSTEQIFEFINLFDHKVSLIEMYTGSYTSDMPSSSLKDILDNLNAKSYANVYGFLDGRIIILPWLHNMDNKDYQADWLKSMKDYNLYEWSRYSIWHGFSIYFDIPEGTEKEWIVKFEEYEIVKKAYRVLLSKTM